MKSNIHIPLAIIQVSTEDRKIPEFNRFWCPQIYTDHRNPLDSLLTSAHCQTGAWESACKVRPNVQSSPGRKRFVLVHYEREGIRSDEVRRSFEDAGIRPATLEEMLALTAQYLASRGDATVIALGSSNIQSPELSYASQDFWYRLLITRKMHARWQRDIEVFPSMNWRNTHSHLRLTNGRSGWKSECVFLGVVQNRDFNTRLTDLKISTVGYLNLPDHSFYTDPGQVELGSKYVAKSGCVCEFVDSNHIIPKQYPNAQTSNPRVGLRHYRPVFTDI